MTTTPEPRQLATQLRALADRLERDGARITRTAPVLASRGYPSTASGAGSPGGRGTSELTATEKAAARRHEYADIDQKWNRMLAATWALVTGGITLCDTITAHAAPESAERRVRRPGSGHCAACGRDVPGTASDRLRSGWCSACIRAWERADRPDRAAFERTRHAELHPPTHIHVDPTAHTDGNMGTSAVTCDA